MLPTNASTFREAVDAGIAFTESLGNLVQSMVDGDPSTAASGAYVLQELSDAEEAMALLVRASEEADLTDKVQFALDISADSFFSEEEYSVGSVPKNAEELLEYIRELREKFPAIVSVTDPFAEEHIGMMQVITGEYSDSLQVALDRLPAGTIDRVKYLAERNACTAFVARPSHFGTVSELIDFFAEARGSNCGILMSEDPLQRAPESFWAHAIVGLAAGQYRCGSVSRASSMCNSLIRIEDEMGTAAFYAGSRFRAPF